MGRDIASALVVPLLGMPFLLAYSIPVAALAIAGPWILRTRAPGKFWLVFLTLATIAGTLVSAVGSLHPKAMGTGRPHWFSAAVATTAVALLMGVPAVVMHRLARRGWSPGRQAAAALVAGLAVVALASPILALWVSCIATGDCI